jgi:hypothetical protein
VSLANLGMPDVIGTLVGFVLTLMVFSYILGDNVFFRVAIHIFIGVAAGYTAVVTFYSVIWPQLFQPLLVSNQIDKILALLALIFAVFLLTKISSRFSILGAPVMAFLVGVGSAAAIGGAVTGTLFPQAAASTNTFGQYGLINGLIVLVGTLATFAYFQFGASSNRGLAFSWLRSISWVGQAFIAITLGALFAGVFAAAMVALVERLSFLMAFIFSFISPIS